MKKDEIEKLIEQQRKNLKFSGGGQQAGYGKFVVNEPSNSSSTVETPKPVTKAPAVPKPAQVYSSQPTNKDYVDIRQLKAELRRKKEEEAAARVAEQKNFAVQEEPVKTSDSQPFGGEKRRPLGELAFENRQQRASVQPLSAQTFEPVAPVPAPKKVLEENAKRVASKKKIDSDLIEKKTYATYFDDLLL